MKTVMRVMDETALPRLSTGDLDLDSLPERLDDFTLAEVEKIAAAPLPALPTCDERTFGQILRMMLAALPRRQADDISGELFVAAYERQLGHMSRPQAEHMMDKALRTCRWFPTIAECLELAGDWRRRDDATARKGKAQALASGEYRERHRDKTSWVLDGRQEAMSQEGIDAMPEELKRIGIKCGALIYDGAGKVVANPE